MHNLMLRVPRILLALPAVAAVTRAATFCSMCLRRATSSNMWRVDVESGSTTLLSCVPLSPGSQQKRPSLLQRLPPAHQHTHTHLL